MKRYYSYRAIKEHIRQQEKHHVFVPSGDPQGISVRVRLKLKQWPNEKERSSRVGQSVATNSNLKYFSTSSLTFSVKQLPFCNACSFDHKHYTRDICACAKDTVLKRDSRSFPQFTIFGWHCIIISICCIVPVRFRFLRSRKTKTA